MDLLVDRGIIPDDSWQIIGAPILSYDYRKGEGGFEIKVEGETLEAYEQRRVR